MALYPRSLYMILPAVRHAIWKSGNQALWSGHVSNETASSSQRHTQSNLTFTMMEVGSYHPTLPVLDQPSDESEYHHLTEKQTFEPSKLIIHTKSLSTPVCSNYKTFDATTHIGK
jgi:hypothetical protein